MKNKTEIIIEHNNISILTLKGNNPLNILTYDAIKSLNNAVTELEKDKSVQALVIKGYGDKAFCSGADITELSTMPQEQIDEYVDVATETYIKIENFHSPVIASINGYAFGAAFELLLTCDLRIMASHAKIGQPAVRHGLVPPFGGLHRLPEIVGMGRAKEIIFTTCDISAEEGYRIGIVNKVCDIEFLDQETLNIAKKIILGKSYSLYYSKQLLNNYMSENVINLEKQYLKNCLKNNETRSQLASFFENNRIKKQQYLDKNL